jgi:DNA-binding CsgD family transcriptional regulator
MMSLTRDTTPVDAWLQWFVTKKQAACRAHLCTWYHLNALDAEALINDALLQVFLHWSTLDNPLAYMWQTLKHTIAKQGQRRVYEQRQLALYTQQHQAHSAACTAEQVAGVLTQVAPRQRQIMAWYAQGYTDVQVAAWLEMTPHAIRKTRHRAYRVLRTQLCLPEHLQTATSPTTPPKKC